MHRFLVILALMLAGLPAAANAQTTASRFDIFERTCPYRAAVLRKNIILGYETREVQETQIQELDDKQWQQALQSCRTRERKIPIVRAPQETLVGRPQGEPKAIYKRPPNVPIMEYYRCNRQTLLPDPSSRSICGPVFPRKDIGA